MLLCYFRHLSLTDVSTLSSSWRLNWLMMSIPSTNSLSVDDAASSNLRRHPIGFHPIPNWECRCGYRQFFVLNVTGVVSLYVCYLMECGFIVIEVTCVTLKIETSHLGFVELLPFPNEFGIYIYLIIDGNNYLLGIVERYLNCRSS